MEAESIVILAPMLQFGCFRASLAVTVSRNFLSLPLNGPPEAVSMMRSIGLLSPTRHWKMAECSESTGRIGHLFLMARSHTSSPATTMVSLFAKAMVFPALRAEMVGCSPEYPTMAVRTMSTGPMAATSAMDCAPANTLMGRSANASFTPWYFASLAMTTTSGLNFLACWMSNSSLLFAVKA